MKRAYPTFIVFDPEDSTGHSYLVYIPDMDLYTEGDSYENAIEMARDIISLQGIAYEDDKRELPAASSYDEAKSIAENNNDIVDFTKGILTLVDVDFSEYRRKMDKKSVRKNVTLPSWLNWEAEQAGINFSKVLQEALISKLDLSITK